MGEIVTGYDIMEEEEKLNVKEVEKLDPEEEKKFDFMFRLLEGMDEIPGSVLEGSKCRKVEERLDLEGRLLAERLPSDAWEKWCKEVVVCFCMGSSELQKVYFANPRDLSAYHVVDFVYRKYKRAPRLHSVGCVLSGSKIYMIGGHGINKGDGLESVDPTDVYYCDVATQAQLPNGGYEWISGPVLNSGKRTPYVFSLAGNIYVLSVDNPHQPFEVLRSGSLSWEVLASPPPPLWTGNPRHRVRLRGSHTIDGKKIFLRTQPVVGTMGRRMGMKGSRGLFVYDAEDDKWTIIEFDEGNGVIPSPLISYYCFHVGRDFSSDETQFPFPGLDFKFLSSEVFGSKFRRPSLLHILHLSGNRFCIIALFTDYGFESAPSCSAQVATLDLNAYNVVAYSDSKLLKKTATYSYSYSISNRKTKAILLHDAASFLPYEFCSKIEKAGPVVETSNMGGQNSSILL